MLIPIHLPAQGAPLQPGRWPHPAGCSRRTPSCASPEWCCSAGPRALSRPPCCMCPSSLTPDPPTTACPLGRQEGMRSWGGPHPQPGWAQPLCSCPCPQPAALTHDGQGRGLSQLAPHGVDDLQSAPIQVAAADGVVARADPVEFAFREVDSQAWKRWVSLPGSVAPGQRAEGYMVLREDGEDAH